MHVTREKEWEAITHVCAVLEKNPDLKPGKAVVLMVSPDYSATAAMHVAHHLSDGGEMLDIVTVDVPYPDEDPQPYRCMFIEHTCAKLHGYESIILVEAGVITGGNFNFYANHLIELGFRVVSVALFENWRSKFQSDIVGFYYHHDKEPLEFYFERDNKHWN